GAPTLVHHRKQVPVGFPHAVEVHRDEVDASLPEWLGIDGEVGGAARTPAAAVNKYHRGRIRMLRLVYVELFDLALPIGGSHRLANDRRCDLVVYALALQNVLCVERV